MGLPKTVAEAAAGGAAAPAAGDGGGGVSSKVSTNLCLMLVFLTVFGALQSACVGARSPPPPPPPRVQPFARARGGRRCVLDVADMLAARFAEVRVHVPLSLPALVA